MVEIHCYLVFLNEILCFRDNLEAMSISHGIPLEDSEICANNTIPPQAFAAAMMNLLQQKTHGDINSDEF